MNLLFEKIKSVSDNNITKTFCYLMSEIGEISDEIMSFDFYKHNHQKVINNLILEAIDAIVCLLDLILILKPDYSKEDFINDLSVKINKWQNKKQNKEYEKYE